MKLEIPARFVDKAHRAVDTTLEATLTQDTVLVPIRMKFNQVVFELGCESGWGFGVSPSSALSSTLT